MDDERLNDLEVFAKQRGDARMLELIAEVRRQRDALQRIVALAEQGRPAMLTFGVIAEVAAKALQRRRNEDADR